VRLREGADGPSLPERAAGVGRRTVGIDGPVPVSNEVVKPAVVPLHVEDEVDEADRPLSESAIAGVTIEVEKEHDGTRSVVDASNPLEAPIARGDTAIFVVGVHPEGNAVRPGGRHASSQPRQLPDHRGQGSRLAIISPTEKSAAATHESAAP